MARWAVIAGVVIGLLILLGWLRGVYTNLLWFDNLRYTEVYRTILVSRIWLFLVSAALFALVGGLNVYLTYRFGRGPQVSPLPDETLRVLRPLSKGGVIFALVIAALIFGGVVGSRWDTVLAFMNATPFLDYAKSPPVSLVDPQFHRGLEFFVFQLPFYHLIQGWLLAAAVVSLLFTVGMYFLHFSLRGAVFTFTTPVRIHVSVLGALLLFVLAWGYWLHAYDLVYSATGAVVGATYTDVQVRIPALRILTVIVSLGGLIFLANAVYVRSLRLMVAVPLLWLGALIVLNGLIPSMVERFQVKPNELRRETPYIERNIKATRAAFGLDRITEQDYPLARKAQVTAPLLEANQETVSNIRLWDHRPFRSLMNQIQFFRLYYTFPAVDVDRYVIRDQNERRLRQVMLGTRELLPQNLPVEAQSWVNRKLQFTHGYGAVVSPVTEFTPEGRPIFFLKDIPPVATTETLALKRPEVYFGEARSDFVIVNSRQDELDYTPEIGTPKYTRYEGTGGVLLSSALRRMAYAWEFRDINVLISGEIQPKSRIQYRRTVRERVHTVAPFLRLDADPYLVISDGRLFWMLDAYTVTHRYPYSTPLDPRLGKLNYIRNSVKVVVDVYDGDVDLYVADPVDPLLLTYQKIFPGLFKPLGQMPNDLRQHIRYPVDLFSIQARQYLTYHMTDPNQFFNKEDQWGVPDEFFENAFQPMEPYYLNMRLPGEKQEEFMLLLPFTPKDKPNMISWLAARSDGEHYGKLLSFRFPKGVQLDGPAQVEARINNDPAIKQVLALLCTGEARCIRGNLLVIPLEGADGENQILYAEPFYLQSAGLAFPELKRVILADGTRVAFEPSLAGAVASRSAPA
jgi:hypothetical protein